MCIGPVGLAETNSTLYRLPAPASVRPYSGSLQAACSTPVNQPVPRYRLMKPGPAISARSNRLPVRSSAPTTASAIWRGALRKARAPAIARLEATSPFFTSAGISTIKAGRSAWGRAPAAMAARAAFSSRVRALSSAACRGL